MDSQPALQEKEMMAFVATDKIQAFTWKLEFQKMCIYHQEFDNFPMCKNCSDKIGGDINECYYFMMYN